MVLDVKMLNTKPLSKYNKSEVGTYTNNNK